MTSGRPFGPGRTRPTCGPFPRFALFALLWALHTDWPPSRRCVSLQGHLGVITVAFFLPVRYRASPALIVLPDLSSFLFCRFAFFSTAAPRTSSPICLSLFPLGAGAGTGKIFDGTRRLRVSVGESPTLVASPPS